MSEKLADWREWGIYESIPYEQLNQRLRYQNHMRWSWRRQSGPVLITRLPRAIIEIKDDFEPIPARKEPQ